MPPEVVSTVELPRGDAVFLDHLAHWVPDMHAASALLERLGFLLTPYAIDCGSLSSARSLLPAGGIDHLDYDHRGSIVPASPALGGTIAFTEDGVLPQWL